MTTDELVDPDADVRYNAKITGYNRTLRRRVREAQNQVELLTTKRVRDTTHAAHEMDPATLERAYERVGAVTRLFSHGYAGRGDIRAEYLSLAATALICAEAADRPAELRCSWAPHLPLGSRGAPQLPLPNSKA